VGTEDRTVETILARLASRSHGVVTRRQLVAVGITHREISHRLAIGALLREHRGVYRVGHRAPSVEARYLAAVLASGDGAVLSGLAAAHLWGLTRGTAPPPEVTTRTERRIAGVVTKRSRSLDPGDATTWRGVPITTVPFTLVALAAQLPGDELARACHEAGVRYGTTPRQIDAVLARRRNVPRASQLRAALHGDIPVTLSKLEARFLALLRDHGLALPQTNRHAGARRVDCRWPAHRRPSSSTATATTDPAMPGSGTGTASARRVPGATSSAATRTATCSNIPSSCLPSFVRSSQPLSFDAVLSNPDCGRESQDSP